MAVVVMVVIAAVTPYWFGREIENYYEAYIDRIRHRQVLRVLTADFQRGWLESRAHTVLELSQPRLQIDIQHRFGHGPLPQISAVRRDSGLAPRMVDVISNLRIGSSVESAPIIISARVALDGATQGQIDLPSAAMALDSQRRLDTVASTGSFFFSPQGHVQLRFPLPKLALVTPGGSLELENMVVEIKSSPNSYGMPLGDTTIDIERLHQRNTTAATPTTITEFELRSRLTDNIGILEYRLQAAAEGIAVVHDSRIYGPATFELNIKGLDSAAVAGARDTLTAATPSAMNLLPLLVNILNTGQPSLHAALDVQTSDGAIDGRLVVQRQAGVTAANVLELLQVVQLNAHLLFPAAAANALLVAQRVGGVADVEDARAQLQRWTDRGQLRRRADGRYEITVRYANSELFVNDARLEPIQ